MQETMKKLNIEARLERIVEQLALTPHCSEGLEEHKKPIGKMRTSPSPEQVENYDQSTAFSDHSDWPNWSDSY